MTTPQKGIDTWFHSLDSFLGASTDDPSASLAGSYQSGPVPTAISTTSMATLPTSSMRQQNVFNNFNSTNSSPAISSGALPTADDSLSTLSEKIGNWFNEKRHSSSMDTQSHRKHIVRLPSREGYALMARSRKKDLRWKQMLKVTPLILGRIQRNEDVSNAVDDSSPFPLSTFLQNPTTTKIMRDFMKFNEAQSKELDEESSSDSDSDSDPETDSFEQTRKWTSTEDHIVRSFPTLLAHKNVGTFSGHRQLRNAMNLYEEQSKEDIVEMNHFEKKQGKWRPWRVIGVIDPNKHLSTLDHSLNLKDMTFRPKHTQYRGSTDVSGLEIVNYHHWIPSVFRVNEEGTDCQLLSEIPNLDPYRNGDTLYPLIADLFLHQLAQFENVLGLNLRNEALKVVVKAQDYQLSDCRLSEEEDSGFLGNFHKEGLHEDIAAVGLYYYQIDEGIKGGELEISSLIGPKLKKCTVRTSEGLSLVFSNDLCYHRVCKLHGDGSRKMIAFFLLRDGADHSLSARNVVVNWKHHSRHFVESNLKQLLCAEDYGAQGNKWLTRLVQQYVVGDRKYVEKAMDLHRHCSLLRAQELIVEKNRSRVRRRHRVLRGRKS